MMLKLFIRTIAKTHVKTKRLSDETEITEHVIKIEQYSTYCRVLGLYSGQTRNFRSFRSQHLR